MPMAQFQMHKRRCALVVILALVAPASLSAQARSHAYVEAGAGATDLNGGGVWLVPDTRISVGAEVGVGWVLLGVLSASYHPLARQTTANHDLFATVGYMALSSSEFSSHGVSV